MCHKDEKQTFKKTLRKFFYPTSIRRHVTSPYSHRYEALKWKGTGRLACNLALIHLIGEII